MFLGSAQLGRMADFDAGNPIITFIFPAVFDHYMEGGVLIFGFRKIIGRQRFCTGG